MDALTAILEWLLEFVKAIFIGGSDVAGGALAIYVWRLILGAVFLVIPYFVSGYALMCTGRKARLNADFMPFIPIARQIYQMRIAKCPVWYIFFFGITTITVGAFSLVIYLVGTATHATGLVVALSVIYMMANMVFTFLYYQKFYSAFGFNPNAAWLNIIPSFTIVASAFTFLIAFSNSIRYGKYVDPVEGPGKGGPKGGPIPQNKGIIVGVSGVYKDATFDLVDGGELTFGRDPQSANIIFDQTQTDISRRHCTIRFDGRTNQYTITDQNSTTGTYLDNGTRLEAGQPKQVARGTVVFLGSSRKNSFRLN